MGAVWLGTDEVLGRQVALKRLARIHDAAHARAEREARLAARLSHRHVVAVYDLVVDGEDSWLVMEYVAGSTLAARVTEQGMLSPEELAPVLSQVIEALEAAHAAGIVHRDVKPSNILIDETGEAKLSDFGIARSDDPDATLTQTGFVTGSPSYLAPETAAGRAATAASDAWSLGATAFHALEGRPPYEVGDNVVGTLYRIVHEEPPHSERAGRLAPLVAGLMTRDPAQRWTLAQARAFLAGPQLAAGQTRVLPAVPTALAPVAAPPVAGARPAGVSTAAPTPVRLREPARHRWAWVAGLAVALVVVALIAGLALHGGDGGTTQAHTDAPTQPASAGSTASGAMASRSASPSPSASPTDGPSEQGIRAFVTRYLQAASQNPATGFAMLTPDYQRRSGGMDGYLRFWGNVRKIHEVDDVLPSLDPLAVSYRYTYTLRGAGERTENVQLRLVYDDGKYLIAGS
jgi:hypothetical protein